MGSGRRPRPARLAQKLTEIRVRLGLTQAVMFEQLGDTGTSLRVGHIGEFETSARVPTLQVVLAYARAAGIPMDVIVDDELDLPDRLPTPHNYEWVMRNSKSVMKRVRTEKNR